MNIGSNDFVLEVGNSRNPTLRSHLLCARFIDSSHIKPRNGLIADRIMIVEADAQYLPFATRSFDYVICSHLLEHLEDPKLAISELQRIAPKGYIETPSEIAERLYGWPYHNWTIRLDRGKLIIQKKVNLSQSDETFRSIASHDRNFSRFHKTHSSMFFVRYEWVGKIDYEILEPDPSPLAIGSAQTIETLLEEVSQIPEWKQWLPVVKRMIPRKIILKMKSIFTKPKHKASKALRELIVCPVCKGAVRWEADRICCEQCEHDYPIVDRIPRLVPPHLKVSD